MSSGGKGGTTVIKTIKNALTYVHPINGADNLNRIFKHEVVPNTQKI